LNLVLASIYSVRKELAERRHRSFYLFIYLFIYFVYKNLTRLIEIWFWQVCNFIWNTHSVL